MPQQLFIVRKPLMVGSSIIYAAGPGEDPVRVDAFDWENLDVLIAQGYLVPDTLVPVEGEPALAAPAAEPPADGPKKKGK